jgi:hypothetical protein
MSILLDMVRDEIMPMVLAAQTPKVTLKILTEDKYEALIIAGRNDAKNRELGFAITHAAIVDGVYKEHVRLGLPRLVMMLEFDGEDPETYFPEDPPWRIR